MLSRKFTRVALALVLQLTVAGCEWIAGPSVCPSAVPGPAVQVEVTDAVSGEYLALKATGRVEKGWYRENMYREHGFIEERYLFADGDGAGHYHVLIEVPGYQNWSVSSFEVEVDECGSLHSPLLKAALTAE